MNLKIKRIDQPSQIKPILWKKSEIFFSTKDYLRKNAQKFSKLKAEMRKENREWFEDARLRYLNKERNFLQKKIAEYPSLIEKSNKEIDQELLLDNMEWYEKKLKKVENTINILIKADKVEITEEMIERAKQFPIEEIVEVNKNKFAHCVNHEDKNASMYCKNNFGYCFSCGWSGDIIAILMKIEGLNFRDAVNKLIK